jgi:pimeloyl-ACP methyl ester carboxylesterase
MRLEHIKIGPVEVAYKRAGSGRPLLLLHGGEADHRYYDEFVELVSPSIQTIAYDQRDCGASVFFADRAYGLIDVAEDAANLIKALGFERMDVLGSSAGGLVSQLIALHWPERVDRLILNVTLPVNERISDINPGLMERRADFIKNEDYRGLAELFSTSAYIADHPEIVEKIQSIRGTSAVPTARQQRRIAAISSPVEADLGKIASKTLVIAGEVDRIVPLSAVTRLASLIPGAELRIIPHAGHTALLENTELYAALVRDFLRSAVSA